MPETAPPLPGRGHFLRRSALLAAGVLLAAGCSASHHRGGAVSTTSFLPSTTTTEPPPQYQPSPYSWGRADSTPLQIGGGQSATLSAVLAPELTGPWQVFGSRIAPSGSPTATAWSSPDALTWRASALTPAGGPSQATAAARYRNATVVVGSTGQAAAQQAAVWVSTGSGTPFATASVPPSDGPSKMDLVATGPLGMFATGTVDGRFAMWSSTDGRQWSELSGAEKVIGSSPGARVDALVANGDNIYAGGSIQPGAVPQAALWSSSDGLNWRLVGSAATSFSGPGGMAIYSLAPFGAGLVAVGAVEQADGWVPASWISPNGQSWSLPSVDFPATPALAATGSSFGPSGGNAARSVAAIPTIGGTNDVVASGGGPYGQAAWESTDGLHWTSLSLPSGAATATSWRAEVTAATADRAVVLDAEPGQPYLLTDQASLGGASSGNPPESINGTWSQPSSDPAMFGPVRPEAVPVSLVHQPTGRLQLTVDLLRRPQTIGPARVTTTVLTSPDGTTWAVAPPAVAPTGYPPTDPATDALTARLPTGWSAVSPATASAVDTWVSPTGASWTRTGELTAPAGASPAGTGTGSSSTGPSPAAALTVDGMCAARLPLTGSGAVPAQPGTSSQGASVTATSSRYLVESVGAVTSVTPAPAGSSSTVNGPTVTRSAAAWSSASGLTWRSVSVNGSPPPGGTASMSGCQQVGSSLVAFGMATNSGGAPQAAIWRSGDGATWTRASVSGLGPGTPAPLLSLATEGDYWVATANPDPAAAPIQPGAAGARGPGAGAGTDAGVGPGASLEDGRQAVWLSADGGSAWQLIDTATAPWLGDQESAVDLAGFASGPAVHAATASTTTTPTTSTTASPSSSTSVAGPTLPTPVVVGVVDGQLVVWIGTGSSASQTPSAG